MLIIKECAKEMHIAIAIVPTAVLTQQVHDWRIQYRVNARQYQL